MGQAGAGGGAAVSSGTRPSGSPALSLVLVGVGEETLPAGFGAPGPLTATYSPTDHRLLWLSRVQAVFCPRRMRTWRRLALSDFCAHRAARRCRRLVLRHCARCPLARGVGCPVTADDYCLAGRSSGLLLAAAVRRVLVCHISKCWRSKQPRQGHGVREGQVISRLTYMESAVVVDTSSEK